ncbi:MAG TPA: TetR/AcrR family transcriptional regulator [Solirubrobacterales bacterium]|nr:TetR/AcrR family transcriptional regulator [Solirubrobacterales bacterium]
MSGKVEPGAAIAEDPVRGRITTAMVELVAEQGLEPTTIAMVCERAAVGRGAFDHSFTGKEDCFLKAHGEVALEFCQRVRAAYDGPSGWHDRIWASGWAAMRFFQEDPQRARFLVVAVNGAGSRAQERRDQLLRGLTDMIDAGRAELAQPQLVSRSTAEMVTGAIYGTVMAKIRDGAIERKEDFLPELVYMAMMPYLGARAAEDELLVHPLR